MFKKLALYTKLVNKDLTKQKLLSLDSQSNSTCPLIVMVFILQNRYFIQKNKLRIAHLIKISMKQKLIIVCVLNIVNLFCFAASKIIFKNVIYYKYKKPSTHLKICCIRKNNCVPYMKGLLTNYYAAVKNIGSQGNF